MREYTKESVSSKLISPFIKAVGLARGSKKLFASAQRVKSDVQKAIPYVYPDGDSFKNRFEIQYGYNADIFALSPKSSEKAKKAVIFLHGGAFIRQPSPLHYTFIDGIVTACNVKLYFVSYKKPPVAVYTDTYSALESLYKTLTDEFGSDNICVVGDSAGASIAISFTDYIIKKGMDKPEMIIAICPVCDLSMTNEKIASIVKKDPMLEVEGLVECFKLWEGSGNISNSEINPCKADFKNLPKMIVFTGTCEILNPDIEAMYETAVNQGAEIDLYVFENMCHDFPLYPVPASKKVRQIIYSRIGRVN